MISVTGRRGRLAWCLAALVVGCVPASAFCNERDQVDGPAPEFRYLPDNPHVIGTVDVQAGIKTKTYQSSMNWLTGVAPPGAVDNETKNLEEKMRQIARFTAAERFDHGVFAADKKDKPGPKDNDSVVVITTIKPVTAAEVKAWTTTKKWQVNFMYKEIKHGSVTIYQETYENKFREDGKPVEVKEGEAFFIAEGKYVVTSPRVAVLKKIIDRNKAATLSANMQAGLKEANTGLTNRGAQGNPVGLVFDFQNAPGSGKKDFLSLFKGLKAHADMKASAGKVTTVVARAIETGGMLKLKVTMICDSPAGAASVKTAAGKTLAEVKEKVKTPFKLPFLKDGTPEAEVKKLLESPEFKKAMEQFERWGEAGKKMANSIKITMAGSEVALSAELEPSTAFDAWMGLFTSVSQFGQPQPPPELKQGNPKGSDSSAEKKDKAAQAQAAAEKFAKALIANRDHPGAMKFVGVPFLWLYGEPTTIDKIDDVKKAINKQIRGPKEPTSIMKIHLVQSLEEFGKSDDSDVKELANLFGKVMKKEDRVVGLYFGPKDREGAGADFIVLIAFVEGEPKVVGFVPPPLGNFGRPKKKN